MLIFLLIIFQITAKPGNVPELAATSPLLQSHEQIQAFTGLCSENLNKKITPENWKPLLQQANKRLEDGGCIQPETALTLVEQVVVNGSYKEYPLAEKLYFKALDIESTKATSTLVEQEVRKVLPLLSPDQQKALEHKLEQKDGSLLQDLLTFWKLSDPVLSTPSNERLLEHWRRLAHARRTFTKNNNTVYNTDDRGTIFIKYGEPSYIRNGMLSPSSTEIRSKLYDLSAFKENISAHEMFNLNMSIKQQYMPRYYEVWVYRNLDTRQPTLFIFGESAEKNTFGLRKSVEEFIPGNAFRMGISSSWQFDTGARGLSAGPFLQMGLYNALSTIDIYFGKQLTQYDQNWQRYMQGQLNFSSMKMMNNRNRAERELRVRQDEAPSSQSSLQKNLDFVEQQFFTFRFLDNRFRPLTRILVFSQADAGLLEKSTQLYGYQNPKHTIRQFAMLLDRNARTVHFDRAEVPITLSPLHHFETASMLEIPSSRFINKNEGEKLLISSEVNRIPERVSERRQQVGIIASHIDEAEDIGTLSIGNNNGFAVSDIIWGYRSNQKNHKVPYLDFSVPVSGKIPSGKNFMMYFETYHTGTRPDSLFNYQIDYSIHRVKKEKLIDTGIALTLNFSAIGAKSAQTLEVKTSELETGAYRIICQFRPSDGGPSSTRTVNFEINEPSLTSAGKK